MQETIKQMLERYDKEQMIVAIEELSELQKEVCKMLRGKTLKSDLYEEVADVLICLEYIKEYYNLDNKTIAFYKKKKIERTRALYL